MTAVDPASTGSAKAIIDKALGDYGLSTLSTWAWQKWQAGESIDQIMLELRSTPEYGQRFPAMKTLGDRGQAISEAQYINYEQSATSIFKAAGLPANFYDQPDDFANFLTNNVALPELQSRVQAYQSAAFSAPQEVRDALQSMYGVSPRRVDRVFHRSGESVAVDPEPVFVGPSCRIFAGHRVRVVDERSSRDGRSARLVCPAAFATVRGLSPR